MEPRKRTVAHGQFDAHFGLATKPGHALTESAAVGSNGLAIASSVSKIVPKRKGRT